MKTTTYEYLPAYQAVITKNGDSLIEVNNESLDSGILTLFQNDKFTKVTLFDGTVGVSKCRPDDTYNSQQGLDIAFYRAQIKRYKKLLRNLTK